MWLGVVPQHRPRQIHGAKRSCPEATVPERTRIDGQRQAPGLDFWFMRFDSTERLEMPAMGVKPMTTATVRRLSSQARASG